MLQQFDLTNGFNNTSTKSIIDNWKIEDNKVFHLKNSCQIKEIRNYYEKVGNTIGEFKLFAEDVELGNRFNQQANKIWMDVRYDSKISDAYRHSSKAQPLHTDGSYNPNYPNSTLMCCISNSASGGETTFLEIKKLVEILKQDDPKLLDFLFTDEILHERSGYKNKKKILFIENEILKINFNYYCVSKNNSNKSREYIEKFFNFLKTSEKIKKKTVEVKLNVGDAIFWKDSEVLHGRNSFLPKKESERFLWKAAIRIGK